MGKTLQISNHFTEDFTKLYALHEHIQTVFKKENKLDKLKGNSIQNGNSQDLKTAELPEKIVGSVVKKKSHTKGNKL